MLALLRERHPEQEFQLDEKGIRGRAAGWCFLSNLHKEVRAAPLGRAQIIQHFVESLGHSMELPLGEESWEDARARLLPLLNFAATVESESGNRSLLMSEWLADVVIFATHADQ